MKAIALCLACLLLAGLTAQAADIELKPVKSTLLDKAGYDPEARELAIQMVNSSDVYIYKDVPASVYEGLLEAESKGAYYVEKIKYQFETRRK